MRKTCGKKNLLNVSVNEKLKCYAKCGITHELCASLSAFLVSVCKWYFFSFSVDKMFWLILKEFFSCVTFIKMKVNLISLVLQYFWMKRYETLGVQFNWMLHGFLDPSYTLNQQIQGWHCASGKPIKSSVPQVV